MRPADGVEAVRKQTARDLLADVRRLDGALAENRRRCVAAVAASGTTLTGLAGISDVLAAKISGHIGDIGRFPSADHLASYAGTAPIEASSGDVIGHRLSRRGNRQLNNAIYLAAHTQTIRPGPGRDYYQRRRDAGNSRNEALRALKRQLTKTIYPPSSPTPPAPPQHRRFDIEALSGHVRPTGRCAPPVLRLSSPRRWC